MQSIQKRRGAKSTWYGVLSALALAGIWRLVAHFQFPLLLAIAPILLKRKRADSKPSSGQGSGHLPGSPGSRVEHLKQEVQLLRERILNTQETFVTNAKVFEPFLTLNEIQLIHGTAEALAPFLHANRVSIFRYSAGTKKFRCAARYSQSKGWISRGSEPVQDRILQLLLESRSALTIREILNNEMLFKIWKDSASKALIYAPIASGQQFYGVLTIDELPAIHLHRQTVQNAVTAAKLMALAFRNIDAHHALLLERNEAQSKLLSEYQQFLRSFNLEFKRAKRNLLPLSLLYVAVEPLKQDQGAPASEELIQRVKSGMRKNLREVDLLFEDDQKGRFWIVLPHTDFNGLAYVMERLNLLVHIELADQPHLACRFGFSFLQPEIELPKQMLLACQESLQLHRTVEEIISSRQRNTAVQK
ncbi:MAG TPA: hypothetical protein ENJ23_05105 [Bacteroidetes bacterium]|nr:hypothetical protein [Bacteroidota bacterium]